MALKLIKKFTLMLTLKLILKPLYSLHPVRLLRDEFLSRRRRRFWQTQLRRHGISGRLLLHLPLFLLLLGGVQWRGGGGESLRRRGRRFRHVLLLVSNGSGSSGEFLFQHSHFHVF